MITGAIKNKVDKIWTDIWAGGITNPLTVIEQLTYLMFIRSLDEKELENEELENMTGEEMSKIFPQTPSGQSMRWSKFKNNDPRDIYAVMSQRIFPAIKALKNGRLPDFNEQGEMIEVQEDSVVESQGSTAFARYMEDAMFLIPTPQVLQKIITGLDDLYEHDIADLDMQGDLYEYMLGKLATAGQNGQFRTPKHIREMMVELLSPTPDDTICDPACGTAGFLVSSAEYIRRKYEDTMTEKQWQHFAGPAFSGFDTDRTMLRISAMNLMLHSISNPDIDYKDSVSKQNEISEKYTMCLANPPFKGTVDAESINDNLKAVTNTKKTELLFLALFLRMLKKGGQCACIVPDGVLFGSSNAHKSIRKELVENHQLRAVISMPSGVFRPYAGVSTAVLVFTKTGAGGTDKVWFYDMKADGFSLDDKRSEVNENDIPDIIERFHHLENEENRERTEQSFFVPKQEIVDNSYDLSINKYKKTEYVAVEYPPTSEILDKLEQLEGEIATGLKELRGDVVIVKLKSVISEYSVRNKQDEDISVYSVTNEQGFCTGYFNKDVSSKDRTNYKIVPYGYFAYNPSRINVGSVDWQHCEERVIVSPLYVVFRVEKSLDQRYLLYFLKSEVALTMIKANASGSVRDNLKLSDLQKFPINLRSIEEQRRIADTLDKVDNLICLCNQEVEVLDKLVKSRFIECFGDMYLNPKGWPEANLESMADVVSGITKGRKTRNEDLTQVPYMAVSNVKDGYIDWTTVKTIEATQQEIEQYRLLPDDVLMTEGGDPDKVGRGAIIKAPLKNCIHQNHIFRVRLDESVLLPGFFAEYLQHQRAKRYFLGCAKQTTGIASINMKQLRALPVLVPPMAEQTAFVSFKAEIDKSKHHSELEVAA